MSPGPGSFDALGFASVPQVLAPRTCRALARRIRTASLSRGTRNLLHKPWCAALVERLRAHPALSAIVPRGHVAVQCTYFEKSMSRNWGVAPHQDLSVPVAEQVDGPGLLGWSRKEGALFVQAPADLLARLVAVRLHLDDCGPVDGPLKVLPGSHRHGCLAQGEIDALRRSQPEVICTATCGEALVMRPLLVHASSKATGDTRRRVLHLVFAPRTPGHALRWADVA